MFVRFKRSISLALLLIFFFPMAEKQLHALEHKDEVHCTSTNKHFHTEEHNCDLCDLALTGSASLPESGITLATSTFNFYFCPFQQNLTKVSAFNDLPSRAPPVA